ncbi:hypothetical protein [Dokdonella sp.]|uniref:hypothetical protein n=1 Tax=Dokdonella sp. TaxID=2291710 RepID=UPI001AFE50D5|nr:hypothetical protein [Dokdonella sp.]MBO9662909.1 hypothetical protein [Dokdonella sp.]
MNLSIRLPALLVAGLCAACAGPSAPVKRTDASATISADTAAPGRLHGYVVGRRHSDFSWKDGKERRYEVEYGWDYDQGVALRKSFDENGALLKSQRIKGEESPLTEAERERVRVLVREYPELKPVVDKPGVVIWAGGFVYRKPGDPHCGDKTRCIHAIAAADDGDTAVSHSIVDLQSDRVVYPFYRPSDEKTSAQH